MASKRRNRYVVVSQSDRELRFRSTGFLTSINIGLNDVQVRIDSAPGSAPRVRYEVRFFGWARYCVVLCAVIGIALIVAWSVFGGKFGAGKAAARPILWVMVIFWGFLWPWILVALHKRPAARALERLFAEVNRAKP